MPEPMTQTPYCLPLVGVTACRVASGSATAHRVVEKYVYPVVEAADCLPLIIPARGAVVPPERFLARLDGVL